MCGRQKAKLIPGKLQFDYNNYIRTIIEAGEDDVIILKHVCLALLEAAHEVYCLPETGIRLSDALILGVLILSQTDLTRIMTSMRKNVQCYMTSNLTK